MAFRLLKWITSVTWHIPERKPPPAGYADVLERIQEVSCNEQV
jgi:hypothetical protein